MPTNPGAGPLAFPIPNPFSWGAGTVIGWIVSGITKAINAFFGGLVKDALNPLLKLLGQTLLTTPDPSSLPRLGPLWENSREIAVAAYALLILAAGILVMAYETVQTRHSIKEIAPRVVVGFLAANTSLLLAGKAVSVANALSTGVMSGGVDPKSAAATLTALVMGAVAGGGIFLIFLSLALACVLLALLVCYVIRVALTVILIAGAPLALMCHALPQTEGIARWWWRAFGGVLAIQLAQSLTLVAALNVFLGKGGFTFFGPTTGGLVDLIVTLALLYILFKIPFWILHAIQIGSGRSFLGGVVKGVIAYKTLGLLGLRGASAFGGRGPGGGRSGGPGLGRGGPAGGPASGPQRPARPGGPRQPSGTSSAAGRSVPTPRGPTRAGGAGVATNGAAAAAVGRPADRLDGAAAGRSQREDSAPPTADPTYASRAIRTPSPPRIVAATRADASPASTRPSQPMAAASVPRTPVDLPARGRPPRHASAPPSGRVRPLAATPTPTHLAPMRSVPPPRPRPPTPAIRPASTHARGR